MPLVADRILVHGGELTANAFKESQFDITAPSAVQTIRADSDIRILREEVFGPVAAGAIHVSVYCSFMVTENWPAASIFKWRGDQNA